MSLGFSLGDFIAVAQLAYQLSKALSESKCATEEYRTLIAELDVVHRVLLQVNDLRASNQLSQPTVNALLFTVNSTRELIESFLDGHSAYSSSLKPGGSGNPIKDMLIKGKWAAQMPIKHSLCAMLAAINCLVSLACYHQTGYDARCYVELRPEIGGPSRWNDIQTAGEIYGPDLHRGANAEFKEQENPSSFFRPGQIFAAQITSCLLLKNKRTFRKIDFSNLPLEPIPQLQAIARKEQLEDMSKRLAQIRQLPLENDEDSRMLKDYWATAHFRVGHHKYYVSMVRGGSSMNRKAIPREEQLGQLPHLTRTEFSAEKWILLEDITLDIPIKLDREIFGRVISKDQYLGGPIMIQRFVVVREDSGRCLCIGIHTYAKQGCGIQSDQELHGVISSSKAPPLLKPNETRISLSPVRMKPDHPSLALSSSARIHYGRAYEIGHNTPVQPLGLIHPASMEVLLNQFEANVARLQPEEDPEREWEAEQLDNVDLQQRVEDVTPNIEAAYTSMNIAKDMRRSMEKVLGPKLELPRDYYYVTD